MQWIKKVIQFLDLRKLIKFSMIGVLNTIVDFVSFFIFNTLFSLNTYTSQILSYLLSALNSFLCNKYWTFEKKNPVTKREALRYLVVNSTYLLCSLGLMYVFTDLMGLHPMLAKVPTAALMMGFNYLASKLWVFK